MMDMQAYIESRLNCWRAELKRAEGRYNSAAASVSEQRRLGHLAECTKCSVVIRELEMLREVLRNG